MFYSSPTFISAPKSILIVDNDSVILNALASKFKKFGFTVFIADNGLDAWDIFKIQPTDFVLMNISMSNVGGKELYQYIRNQALATKIAGTSDKIDAGMELLNDFILDYFFPKPFDITNLCRIFIAEAQVDL